MYTSRVGFDRGPLALVLRRDLVPVLQEVGAHIAIGRDVADEELRAARAAAAATAHGSEADDAVAMQPFAEPPPPQLLLAHTPVLSLCASAWRVVR